MIHADALAAALRQRPLHDIPAIPGRTNHKLAPVLVPLRWDNGHPEVILTERSPRLRDHAGEVSFPGGKPEPGDADAWATARREAQEEIGLPPSRVRRLGPLSHMPLGTSDYRLHPFVGEVDPAVTLQAAPGEVQRLLRVRLDALFALPRLHGIPFRLTTTSGLSPVFELDGALVFGGTAHTLLELMWVVSEVSGRPVPPLEAGRYRWGRGRVERVG